ncbi:hypothetical protein HHI36_004771, partial [Cryptolaemus montrouzieri]
VLLGAGGTTVPRSEYEKLDFRRMKYTIAVRRLDPVRVGDIRLHVAKKYNIDTSLVNKAITVALADARKTKKRKIEKEDSD